MTDVYANQTEKGDAVSLVRNASSSGNKVGVTTYAAIRDCNLALQCLRLPEHRIKREEYGTGQFALSEIGRYYFNVQNDRSFERFQRSIIIYKGGCECVCNTYVKTKISHLHRMSSLL